MADNSAILKRIAAFQDKHYVEDSRFGVMAVNDPHLIADLRDGRAPRRFTMARIDYLIKHGKPMPKKHTRPA